MFYRYAVRTMPVRQTIASVGNAYSRNMQGPVWSVLCDKVGGSKMKSQKKKQHQNELALLVGASYGRALVESAVYAAALMGLSLLELSEGEPGEVDAAALKAARIALQRKMA